MEINFNVDDIENIVTDVSNQGMIDISSEGEPEGIDINKSPDASPDKKSSKKETPEPENTEEDDFIEVNVDEPEGGSQDAPENGGTPKQSSADDSTPSPYMLFGKKLYEEGVLTVFDEEKVKTLEDLQDMVAQTIDAEIDAYKEALPPAVRKIVEHAERTGEVNLKAAIETQQKVIDYNNITEKQIRNDEDLQEQILYKDLIARKYSEKRARNYIEAVKANEMLEDEAIEALAARKEAAKEEAERIERETEEMQKRIEQERQDTIKAIRRDIDATTEILPGVKLTKREQDAIFESMTSVVGQDNNGNPVNAVYVTRSKNPLAFERMLHFLHSKGVFNVDKDGNPAPDWGYFTKGIKTTVAKNAAKAAESSFKAGSPDTSRNADDDLLNALRGRYF